MREGTRGRQALVGAAMALTLVVGCHHAKPAASPTPPGGGNLVGAGNAGKGGDEGDLGAAKAGQSMDKPGPSASDCDGVMKTAMDQVTAKHDDAAIATLQKGYDACGAGHGFLGAEGYILADEGKIDDGAALMMREIQEPEPLPSAFDALYAVFGEVSPTVHDEILELGRDIAHPIHVPDISYEYKWINSFVCGGKQAQNVAQALVDGPTGQLDELDFDCGDKKAHSVFFDFSADPTEKAYQNESQS